MSAPDRPCEALRNRPRYRPAYGHGRGSAHPHRLRGGLHLRGDPRMRRVVRIGQHCDAREPRQGLAQQLDVLRAHVRDHVAEAGDVSAGPRKACHESAGDGIADGDHDDGNRRRRGVGDLDAGCRIDDQNVDPGLDELIGKRRKPAIIAVGEAPLDLEVLAFDVAQLPHSGAECLEPIREICR